MKDWRDTWREGGEEEVEEKNRWKKRPGKENKVVRLARESCGRRTTGTEGGQDTEEKRFEKKIMEIKVNLLNKEVSKESGK